MTAMGEYGPNNATSVTNEPPSREDFISKLSPEADIGIAITVIASTILSVAGNGLVLLVYYKKRRTVNSFDLLTINMAVSDITYALFGHWIQIDSALNHEWRHGVPSCQAYGFLSASLNYVSIVTLSFIAITRYVKVCSNTLDKWVNKSNTVIAILIIWIYSLLWALPPLAGWNRYVPEPFGTSCTLNWKSTVPVDTSYTVCLFVFIFFIPLVTIVICYCCIICKTSYQRKVIERSRCRCSGTRKNVEKRLTKMAVAMTLAFFLSWGPYATVALWTIIIGRIPPIPMAAFACVCVLAKCATICNPVLVLLFNGKFRRHAQMLFGSTSCSTSCYSYTINLNINISWNESNITREIDASRQNNSQLNRMTTNRSVNAETTQMDSPDTPSPVTNDRSWPRIMSISSTTDDPSPAMEISSMPNAVEDSAGTSQN
ncbi:opsin-5-like [Glandiceps talaboti]